MSPEGTVTGSSYASGGFAPGGGLRNWGFKGTPVDRLGSTARARLIRSHIPCDWTVYF